MYFEYAVPSFSFIRCLFDAYRPSEIYTLYKKRWSIETYYNYFKNKEGYKDLRQQNYYKLQGLAFIMLVSALIHREMDEACKKVKGMSIYDCLLDAMFVKSQRTVASGKLET